jgi:hypothetical protein
MVVVRHAAMQRLAIGFADVLQVIDLGIAVGRRAVLGLCGKTQYRGNH